MNPTKFPGGAQPVSPYARLLKLAYQEQIAVLVHAALAMVTVAVGEGVGAPGRMSATLSAGPFGSGYDLLLTWFLPALAVAWPFLFASYLVTRHAVRHGSRRSALIGQILKAVVSLPVFLLCAFMNVFLLFMLPAFPAGLIVLSAVTLSNGYAVLGWHLYRRAIRRE